jgi:polyferredoxin
MLFERNPRKYRRPSSRARQRWARLLYLACALTLVPSLFIHPHSEFGFAEIPAFHALLAFLTGCALVLVAIVVRRILIRAENYYEHRT